MDFSVSISASPGSIVSSALSSCRGAFVAVALFSAIINLLMLSGSFYMLQVYDRVLSSRSIPTLIGISALLFACYVLQGVLDMLRVRLLARIGARFNAQLSPRTFSALRILPLIGYRKEHAMQPVRDLDQIRSFLSSLGPTALFDMPWTPLFVAGCFFLHPWLGWLAIGGGAVILGVTWLTDARGWKASKAQLSTSNARHAVADSSIRNTEVLAAMGMGDALQRRWLSADAHHVTECLSASDSASGPNVFAKMFRIGLQSAVLGLGAYLVIRGELSGGAMIAASVLTSRALAPMEIALSHWKGFLAARQGLQRIRQLLELAELGPKVRTALPRPVHNVTVTDLAVGPPGSREPLISGVSLTLKAGDGLAVFGASASGKTTLARALVGAWRPLAGDVRLDGAALGDWDASALGRHIGYLPQDISLLEGTVAENIARFQHDATSEAIVSAAMAAGAHEMILKLPDGYETVIDEGGASVSGGQRQRIALARALYGDPFLVVLDEPNANLDQIGDKALTAAIQGVQRRGGIVVMITHRQSAMETFNLVAILNSGRLVAYGSKAEIEQKLARKEISHSQTRRQSA